jgi:RNase P/RNase MRP subunit POP5
MKALKPSAKENKRYLLLKGKNLKKNVPDAIRDFIGKLGMSKCGLSWVKNNIICINREMVDSVRASLCAWPERIDVEKVSGTLKGLGKK